MNKKSISVLIPYFGDLPWYINYFLHSCKFNPTVDFFLISDTKEFKCLPNNVTHIIKTLEEVNNLASYKLGFKTNINNGYKFCDFKPAYGYLFSDLIEGYDFWGQSDIDIIYGDIRSFVPDDLLEQYDYINVRHDFVTGFFSLFRNNETMNTLFKRSCDYEKVFSSPLHYCFDECNNVHNLISEGKSIFEVETEIQSFMYVLKDAERKNEIRTFFDFICIEGNTGKIRFENGKIIYKRKYEAILYHLIAFKKTCLANSKSRHIPDVYRISPSRIYH